MTAPANPNTTAIIEDLGHVGNPSKHCAVDVSSANVDVTDSAHLNGPCIGIYVGTSGDLCVAMQADSGGSGIVYKNVPAGAYIPGLFVTVFHTNTSANNLVAVGK